MLPKYLKPYAKFVAAAGGIGLMVWTRHAGILIPGLDALTMDMLMGALVSLGVYQVRNTPHEPKPGVKK